MRRAVIDIGTNTVLLLVAEKRPDGAIVAVVERARITRLGQGVDRARKLLPEAEERTLACVREFVEELRAEGAQKLAVVATSAARDGSSDVTSTSSFLARLEELAGVPPRILTGEEEAELAFRGGLSGLEIEGPEALVFDVGGGSTEIVLGTCEGARPEPRARVSLELGAVRLTERFLRSDPPEPAEVAALRHEADSALCRVPWSAGSVPVVGTAGTVTTLAAIAGRIEPYQSSLIHGLRLTTEKVLELAEELSRRSVADRKLLPGLEPGRADVIAAGAVIVAQVLRWANTPSLVVSDRGVRWGLAIDLFAAT